MKDSNNITLPFAVSGSFQEITCSVCGKKIGIAHIHEHQKNESLQDFSCFECSKTFYNNKSIDCYLCGKRLQADFSLVGEGEFKRKVCAGHPNAERMVREKENSTEYDTFIEKCGKRLKCSYCGETFEIDNYDDLSDARYVHKQMGAGIEKYGGPFCCSKCLPLIKEEKIKFCIECGKQIKGGKFCSSKCDIAYCEN